RRLRASDGAPSRCNVSLSKEFPMDLELSDRLVVVTGASKGIGYACAAAFAAEGARIVMVSRSRANLDAAIARLPRAAHVPAAIVANLVQADQAQHMVEKAERDHGPID